MVASPIKYDNQMSPPMSPPPTLGGDTFAVLEELLDMDSAQILALANLGAIGLSAAD